ncbi:MAG: HAD family hydrolase [Pseudomonadota bacterium]
MLDNISIVAFDLDDTLWPCLPTINHAENTLYRWLSDHYPRVTEQCDPDQMISRRREFTAKDPRYSVDLTGMRYDFLRHLGEQHGYDGEELSHRGFEVFFDARQQVTFYDDVLPCLERLGQRFRLGAISNGNASIEHVGLGHLIEHAISASELKVAKPDPIIYQTLADHFDVSLEQIVYVGDHPHYDVVGPIEAGCRAVWINREDLEWPEDLDQPEHQITDLHQLEALLKG